MDIIAQAAGFLPVDKRTFEIFWGISSIAAFLALLAGVVWLILWSMRRKPRQLGYATVSIYLRAIPESDAQKADAVAMLARGVTLCFLGVIFPPLVILGAVPLYYGCRKIGSMLIGVRQSAAGDGHGGQSGPAN